MQSFFGQMPLLQVELAHFIKTDYTVILAVSKEKETKLTRGLHDVDVPFTLTRVDKLQTKVVNIVSLNLTNGFNLLDEKIAVITETEIFGKTKNVVPND